MERWVTKKGFRSARQIDFGHGEISFCDKVAADPLRQTDTRQTKQRCGELC